MPPIVYYLATIAVFFFIYNILTWGLNIQFGLAGILDFAYIVFFAIGAYIAGVLALGPADPALQVSYILGWNLPYPLPLIGGALAAGLLGLLIGFVALNRLRSDYLAIVTVALASIAYTVIGNASPLFDGQDGLSGVPEPFNQFLNLNPNDYQFFFLALSGVVMVVLWWVANRITYSPYGRALRGIREDEDVVAAFGKNTFRMRMTAMVVGGMYGGVGGALTIAFIGAINPSGWAMGETFVLWAAMLIGGMGNMWGSVLGALLVPILFTEATRFLPPVPGHPGLIDAVRNIVIGVLLILVLWYRPQGVIPERKRLFRPQAKQTVAGGEGLAEQR